MALFRDRADAGRALAQRLGEYAGREDVVVLGLARGGVEVAAAVAEALHAPVDVIVVRKVGHPQQPELAIAAVAFGGVLIRNEPHPPPPGFDELVARGREELERKEARYRSGRPARPLAGRVVIVVDDGLATGASMRAALTAVRRQGPARLVAAAPVGPPGAAASLRSLADESLCAAEPPGFSAVGAFYDDFGQVSDEAVEALLA